MDHLISMYIDNELDLNEKIIFVEHCYHNKPYVDEAVALLEQEKQLDAALNHVAPDITLPMAEKKKILRFTPRFMGLAVAACLLILLSFSALHHPVPPDQADPGQAAALHRFVIYEKGSRQVEITGSFTDWQRISLAPTGTQGYWEITLPVSTGEHRYTFIVDGSKLIPDPTVVARETDDFGTANSILRIQA